MHTPNMTEEMHKHTRNKVYKQAAGQEEYGWMDSELLKQASSVKEKVGSLF